MRKYGNAQILIDVYEEMCALNIIDKIAKFVTYNNNILHFEYKDQFHSMLHEFTIETDEQLFPEMEIQELLNVKDKKYFAYHQSNIELSKGYYYDSKKSNSNNERK
jgi:hypothetical protein